MPRISNWALCRRSRCGAGVNGGGRRRRTGPVERGRDAVTQGRPEDDTRADGAERETASHTAHLLRRQPATRRSDEGTARRDDRAESARHPRLVPEQALQRQETQSADETDTATTREGRRSLRF